jgi:hypothetical protein
MVQDGLHEALAVALIEEELDVLKLVEELQQVLQGAHLQVLEVVAALLQYAH